MKDLIVLVADKDCEQTFKSLLSRYKALRIKPIEYDIYPDPAGHDPGVLKRCQDFLRPNLNLYRFSLVIFDYHGCGEEYMSAIDIEKDVEKRLKENGWEDRSACIVIDPELEAWIWSNSPHVANLLGWNSVDQRLKDWLIENKYLIVKNIKPSDPKTAFEAAIREAGKPRSSSIFAQLARKVSLRNCQDRAFQKVLSVLRNWFPED